MHRYLESSPECDPGFRKEYHVWDALDLPSGRLARERIELLLDEGSFVEFDELVHGRRKQS